MTNPLPHHVQRRPLQYSRSSMQLYCRVQQMAQAGRWVRFPVARMVNLVCVPVQDSREETP
ncbi:hypothetical protein LCGC14_0850590 [marine sediment metagenome]|uniref:Uncharacterized protein n=1 Tax=marine sediment metagenome TaxID=412755 RepID=A0A0F9RVA1_9ZZZZ